MGLVVVLPDLGALQEKREAETLTLDGPSNLLGLYSALIWTPSQMAYCKKNGCHRQDKHVTSKLIFSWHE